MNLFDPPREPDRAVLRRFAALWLPLFVGGGAILHAWRGGSRSVVAAALAACAASVAVGLVRPTAAAAPYRALLRITSPLGRCLSPVLLAVIYFGVVTPVGVAWRLLRGAGAFPERPDRKAGSYWLPRAGPEGPDAWRRRF